MTDHALSALHVHTPLIESVALGENVGDTRIYLKLDALQPCASFKARGMGHACQQYVARGAEHLVCSSGGNAGLAVAWAGRLLNVPVDVVVPVSTGRKARDLIEAEGATVTIHGESWMEAHAFATDMLTKRSAYLHPFDDPLVWEGHASMVDEIAHSGVVPDTIILSVGGGGLLAGVAEGLRRNGLTDTRVHALETEGANALAASVARGEPVTLERIDSIAVTLGAKRICDRALELAGVLPVADASAQNLPKVTTEVVSDAQALNACYRFANDHRLLVEPACGAALAAVYARSPVLKDSRCAVVIVCGGAGVDLNLLDEWTSV